MDILDDELLKFWRSVNAHHVRYIMVGGFATRFHRFNRNTDDLDIWPEDTLQNRKNLRNSFIELSYGDFPGLETMEFLPGWKSFYLSGMIELDIMTKMKDWKITLSVNVWISLRLRSLMVCLSRFYI